MSVRATDVAAAKVFIVDDVPANLDLLYQTLSTDGHTVLAAPNGETALKLAVKSAPDLILLDRVDAGIERIRDVPLAVSCSAVMKITGMSRVV
jgi:CheY-like chemotaxis protein